MEFKYEVRNECVIQDSMFPIHKVRWGFIFIFCLLILIFTFYIYVTNPETYYLNTGFSNNEEYNNFLNTIKERSNISFNENVNENDKILTLSTCTNLNTKRLVVHATLVYEEVK